MTDEMPEHRLRTAEASHRAGAHGFLPGDADRDGKTAHFSFLVLISVRRVPGMSTRC